MAGGTLGFGGIERVTGRSFLVEVDKRDAATLIPIIQQYIRYADYSANYYSCLFLQARISDLF